MKSKNENQRVVITGAAGEVGTVLCAHFRRSSDYELMLLDRESRDRSDIRAVDLSRYADEWVQFFAGADAVLHLAGEPRVWAPWSLLAENNIEVTFNVFRAAAQHKVRRVVFASSLQTMEGHRYEHGPITANATPRPVSLYAVSKLVGEIIARRFSEERGLSAICLRMGSVQTESEPPNPSLYGWPRCKWLSAEDLCQGFEKAILVEDVKFAILPLVSNNAAMRWDLSETHRVIGYTPSNGAATRSLPLYARFRLVLSWARKRFLDPTWRAYWK